MKTAYTHRWYHFIWRWCYTALIVVLTPLAVMLLYRRYRNVAVKPKGWLSQRFGLLPAHLKQDGILIHCVSMGEVNTASGLIKTLQSQYPDLPITISTTSTTGHQQVLDIFADTVQHIHLPIDLPVCMSMMLARVKPRLLLVVEVEIWPNLLHQCYRRNVPTILINARMTASATKLYQSVAWLFRPTLRKFDAIFCQASQDFEHFLQLGVYKPNLLLTNNLKFDLHLEQSDADKSEQLQTRFALQQRCILIGASTHDTEELLLINQYLRLKPKYPNLLLMLVPRYPHRFDEVANLLKANGLRVQRFSASQDRNEVNYDVILMDQIGWLKACYSVSHIAFVGGSYFPKGGHNALEAALYSLPIIMGPSVYNNQAICDELQASGGLSTHSDVDDFYLTFDSLLADPALCMRRGNQSQSVIAENQGATQCTFNHLQTYL